MTFLETLDERSQSSLLCIGLDPVPALLPESVRAHPDPVYAFCAAIIEATADLVCAYKPNIAFFEALGTSGIDTLRRLLREHHAAPMILDAKRGDIGSTATAYAQAAFEYLGADAITLNPYLGGDALEPFLRYTEHGCFLLCKTSNPGSADLQDLTLADGRRLYHAVAERAASDWNRHGNVGLVVGATHAAAIAEVRALAVHLPLLIPGVGVQGGDLEQAVRAAVDASGGRAIINSSRGILYASSGPEFAQAARAEAIRLRDAINRVR